MEKRGLSSIVTTLIIILLVFISIGIIWAVIGTVIQEKSELVKIRSDFFNERIQIKSIIFDDSEPLNIVLILENLAGRVVVSNSNLTPEVTINPADVFSVVDLSGSMRCDAPEPEGYINQNVCEVTYGGNWLGPLNALKDANLELLNILFSEDNGNKLGIVAYNSNIIPSYSLDLTDNVPLISSTINSWWAQEGTCLCCGINEAKVRFLSGSSSEISKTMIVMSDGETAVECAEQGSGDAIVDAIQSACEVMAEVPNLTIHSVGFGTNVDNSTLIEIAACGGGNYYNVTNLNDLIGAYTIIAQEIQTNSTTIHAFENLRIIFFNETSSYQIDLSDLPNVLETLSYSFNLNGHITEPIIRIEIYPLFISGTGEETVGPLLDYWEEN